MTGVQTCALPIYLAEAISGFSWDMYCYNAALKIGNQLLSQSLIDYMR